MVLPSNGPLTITLTFEPQNDTICTDIQASFPDGLECPTHADWQSQQRYLLIYVTQADRSEWGPSWLLDVWLIVVYQYTVKPSFHYPSWRVMQTGHPSTRAIKSGRQRG